VLFRLSCQGFLPKPGQGFLTKPKKRPESLTQPPKTINS
jgi:hypothetical protein